VTAVLLFYLLVYVFMNLGAFTVAAVIAAATGSDDIRDYAGMSSRSPLLMVLMSLFLLSLFGMPGLGGFLGKVFLMTAMAKFGPGGFALIAVLLINTLVSLYYYVRPMYFMVLVRDDRQRPAVPLAAAVAVMLVLCAAGVIWTGLSGGSRLVRDHAAISLPNQATGHAVGGVAQDGP
jgi:NADH-quinone oxidoreductase subunit N